MARLGHRCGRTFDDDVINLNVMLAPLATVASPPHGSISFGVGLDRWREPFHITHILVELAAGERGVCKSFHGLKFRFESYVNNGYLNHIMEFLLPVQGFEEHLRAIYCSLVIV